MFCCFTCQVNSYGHGGMVSSPNHTFSSTSLNKQLTSTSWTYFRLLLTTTLLERCSGKEKNDRRNYFMINLHESMGPGWDPLNLQSDLYLLPDTLPAVLRCPVKKKIVRRRRIQLTVISYGPKSAIPCGLTAYAISQGSAQPV